MIRHRFSAVVAVTVLTTIASVAIAQSSTTTGLRVHTEQHDIALGATDLAGLPRHRLRVAAEDSPDSATVAGMALWDILQKAGVPSAEASGRQRAATYVRLVGADGQTAIFALAEVDPGFSRKSVIVADQRNGRPLDPAEGPWRVFVPDDLRHARWIRGLVKIDVGTLPR